MSRMLGPVKLALRVMTDAFDTEIEGHIDAALLDLDLAGVSVSNADLDADRPLILQAVKLYCKLHFGEPDRVEAWDRLKSAYDDLKATLSMSTCYRKT